MEVIRLPVGKQAPVDADCIRVEQVSQSAFRLTASAMCAGSDESESVTVIEAPSFNSAEEAEAAGLAWAAEVGVERLFVILGTLAQPLELIEIDKPS